MKQTKQYKPIGILGGTFDPIHYGHIQLALTAQQTLPFSEVHFVLCRQPPLKKIAHANIEHRLAMLELACAPYDAFQVDKRELHRETPSYTVDTLLSFQQEFPEHALCLLLGMDAFITLPQWDRWQELIKLAHLLIANRPNYQIPQTEPLSRFIQQHQIDSTQQLLQKKSGYLLFMQSPLLAISSHHIRKEVAQHHDQGKRLTPEVWHYIQEHDLYALETR